MKKLIVGICLLASTFGARALQNDFSFLTNRAGLVSYALQQVTNVEVSAYAETSPSPQKGNSVWAYHNGEPTVESLAKTVSSVPFNMSVADTNGYVCVNASFYGPFDKEGNPQSPLFTAGVCAKPIYDVGAGHWKFPRENARPELYLYSQIFIKAPGIGYAALITTNRWGGYTSRQLPADYWNEGFWFDADMCGSGLLVFSGYEKVDGSVDAWKYVEYVYDLWGSGQRRLPTQVEIAILLRDSQDMRDFGKNPEWLGTWVSTWTYSTSEKGGGSDTITYGKIPLLIAKFDKAMTANIYVGSSVGTARSYRVKNLTTGAEDVIMVPNGSQYVPFQFKSGVYHIIPLGIPVTQDWWRVQEFLNSMGIPVGKG